MASALSQHEELSRVLARHEELLAAAEAIAPTVPYSAASVAAAHAAAGGAANDVPPAAPGELLPHHRYTALQGGQGQGQEVPTQQKVVQTASASEWGREGGLLAV